MTAHLLALEIGPVAPFIAAARKTRDLWFGSWMLSEIAKAAAKAVADACGTHKTLIFPAPTDLSQLEFGSDFTVADEVLAELPAQVRPEDVAAAAKKAVDDRWREFARKAHGDVPSRFLRLDTWDDQTLPALTAEFTTPILECYAAWVELNDYPNDRKYLKRLLAGRTNCRNFPPAARPFARVPKSSLDGARETVLAPPDSLDDIRQSRQAARLRLTRGEQLDAPGVVKRVWGERRSYPSVSRIAADPWLRGARERFPELFAAFRNECERLRQAGIVGRIDAHRYPHYSGFPFEGGAVYPTRYVEMAEESECDLTEFRTLATQLKVLSHQLGEAEPYYAILVADGDKIGQALNRLGAPAAHRRFSQKLATFAGRARDVTAAHSGVAVYVGGDDVLAFLPVDTAVRCANELRVVFNEVATELQQDFPEAEISTTLSVGIAIGHFLTALEEIYATAQESLAQAKISRNALAVTYSPRGGSPITVSREWKSGFAADLYDWANRLASGQLPDKVAYDLRELARDYETWPDLNTLRPALRADVARLLSAKQGTAREDFVQKLNGINEPKDLIELANIVLIARRIERSIAQAAPAGGAS